LASDLIEAHVVLAARVAAATGPVASGVEAVVSGYNKTVLFEYFTRRSCCGSWEQPLASVTVFSVVGVANG
jgi:hypothetical protein